MTTMSTQPGSHWALARLAAKVLAGLVLAVWAVSLLAAHYAHLVWGGSRGGSLSPQSPLLMHDICNRFGPAKLCFDGARGETEGSHALPLLLGIAGAALMARIALERRRHAAQVRTGGA